MKTNKAWDVNTYAYVQSEPVLIDANIWLYLQPPASKPAPKWTRVYSQSFRDLLAARAQPIIDALVLSEYANRYLRLEYVARWQAQYPDFKIFRKSQDGQALSAQVAAQTEQILKLAGRADTPLSGINFDEVLTEVSAGTLDFNDAVLVEACRLNGWKLMTNDSDMSKGGIEVITSNQALIAACV